jgi:hypothetical protein
LRLDPPHCVEPRPQGSGIAPHPVIASARPTGTSRSCRRRYSLMAKFTKPLTSQGRALTLPRSCGMPVPRRPRSFSSPPPRPPTECRVAPTTQQQRRRREAPPSLSGKGAGGLGALRPTRPVRCPSPSRHLSAHHRGCGVAESLHAARKGRNPSGPGLRARTEKRQQIRRSAESRGVAPCSEQGVGRSTRPQNPQRRSRQRTGDVTSVARASAPGPKNGSEFTAVRSPAESLHAAKRG